MKKLLVSVFSVSFLVACQNQATEEKSASDTQAEQSKAQENDGQSGPALELLWETEASLKTNESVLYYPQGNHLFVSCIDGKPTDKDGKGYIAKVDLEGNIIDSAWATGFNAPKGMCISQGRLFFSDIDRIVSVSLNNPADKYEVEVPGGEFLNDLSPGLNGVYFSDMSTGMLYYLENQVVHTINPELPNLNGLNFFNQSIYALSNNGLQRLSPGGEVKETINAELSGGDGLIVLDDNRFIMSRWQGEIWYVSNGEGTKLLDSKAEEIQTADIGYNPNTKTLFVPRFFANKVSAYRLKGI